MQSENLTPFTSGTVVWLLRAGEYRLSFIVKAGFSVGNDGVLETNEEQPLLAGDNPSLQGPDDPAALEAASDAVAFKLRGEVLLNGTAYVPAEQGPRTVARVGVQVGDLTKSLVVFGPRDFEGQLDATVTEPQPFTEVPLTYANAYGGKGERRNPVGKGRDGKTLPNIEYLDRLIHNPADRPPPAGFGPISPNWEPRRSMMGTYGGNYLEKYWPGFPPDFDWSYFNAAPRDQQSNGYLRGDEAIALEGMHPEQPLIRTQLPGLRIVAIREDHDGSIARVPMNLDTLWIDADALTFHLTWRGLISVATFEALEIKRLGLLVESVDAPELEAAAYVERLDTMIAERDREFEEEPPPDEPEPEPEASDETTESPGDKEEDPLPPEVAAQIEAIKTQFPQPETPKEPPELSPEARAEADRIMREVEAREQAESNEEAEIRWTRERVIAAVAAGESLADADLSELDLSEHVFGAVDFKGAKLEGVDFSHSDLTGAQFSECMMGKAQMDDAVLQGADLSASKLAGASLCRADLTRAVLNGAELEDATLDDAVMTEARCVGAQCKNVSLLRTSLIQSDFSDADLTGAQLDEADLAACTAADALFANASLSGAALSSAKLERADFSEANMAGARLPGVNLAGASGTGARLKGADLRRADLTGTDFNGADLSEALLDGATATDADFTEANLGKASLRRATLEGAWLSSAVIDDADLQEADCTDLQLDGTRARRANFCGTNVTTLRGSGSADFTGADFRQVSGTAPIFEGCIVDGANFSHADLPGANFIQVSALQANFTAVDMPGVRFTLADCREAVFNSANLFEGSFEAADLSRAVLDGANCYGVEFLDAKLGGVRLEGANVLMTELSR